MKMVAAAKVKRSEQATKLGRPFTKGLVELFRKLLYAAKDCQFENQKFENCINNYPALLAKREIKTVGLLVLTSNKGLAGAYNANLIRKTLAKIEEYTELLKNEGPKKD